MYRILVGDQVVYDSTDKVKYPVTEPVLNLELGQAGSLEFSVSPDPVRDPNKTLINKLKNVKTLVTAEQDGEEIFFGRVLSYEEDMFGAIRVTCEGALTFLLDTEMEKGNYTENVVAFFRRCIDKHNSTVGPDDPRYLKPGKIVLDTRAFPTIRSRKETFKVKGYNDVSKTFSSLVTQKYGGHLEVVKDQNGSGHQINYIQRYTRINSAPVEIGTNVISQDKTISGDKLFTVLRPLGKNNLTIEKAQTGSLIKSSARWETGKKLVKSGGENLVSNGSWKYYDQYISVKPDHKYIFGPGNVKIALYYKYKQTADYICFDSVSFEKDPDTGIEPNTYTIPNSIVDVYGQSVSMQDVDVYVRVSMQSLYTSKGVLKEEAQGSGNVIAGEPLVQSKMITTNYNGKELIKDNPDWCYCETFVPVSVNDTYIAVPSGFIIACYTGEPENYKFKKIEKASTAMGGDVFRVPANITAIRVSFPNRYTDTFAFEKLTNECPNLITGGAWVSGKYVEYQLSEHEEADADWAYTKDFISADEYSSYTAGFDLVPPDSENYRVCKARLSCYDKNKKLLALTGTEEPEDVAVIDPNGEDDSGVEVVEPDYEETQEEKDSALQNHIFFTPKGTKYVRLAVSTENLQADLSDIKLQRGEIMIREEYSKSDKTIEIPAWIERYGKIIRTETFSDITDANRLYLAAVDFINRTLIDPPLEIKISLVDYHFLNPDAAERIKIGDIFNNVKGTESATDRRLWVASLSKNMENPAEDSIVLKNRSALLDSNSSGSSGTLSSAYAGGQSTESSRYKHIVETLSDAGDELAIGGESLKYLKISAHEEMNLISRKVNIVATDIDKMDPILDIAVKVGKDWVPAEIEMTKDHILSRVTDETGKLYSEIEQTKSYIRHTVTDLEQKLSSQITQTAEGIIGLIKDDFKTLTGDFELTRSHFFLRFTEMDFAIGQLEMTARHLWAHFADFMAGLTSTLDLTAEHLQLGFTDAIHGLTSELEMTAQHFWLKFEQTDKAIGELEMTARHLWAHFQDLLNQLESTFELTAEHLQLSFKDALEGYSSELEMTAKHFYLKFEQTDAAIGELEMTARKFSTYFKDLQTGVQSLQEQTADHIASMVGSIYRVDDEVKAITGSAIWQTRDNISAIVGRMYIQDGELHITEGSGLVIDKDTQQGTESVKLGTYVFDKLTAGMLVEKLSDGETKTKISGDHIDLSSVQTVRTAAGSVLPYDTWRKSYGGGTKDNPLPDTAANQTAYETYIQQNAASIVLQAANPDNIVSRINLTASQIKLSADKIELDGDTIASAMSATSLYTTGVVYANTGLGTNGTINCAGIVTDAGINLDEHSHSFTMTESNGVITVTLGEAVSSAPDPQTFNLASTSWYRNTIVGAMLGNNLGAVSISGGVSYVNNSGTDSVSIPLSLTFPTGQTDSTTRIVSVSGIPQAKTPSNYYKRSSANTSCDASTRVITGTGTLQYTDNSTVNIPFSINGSSAYTTGLDDGTTHTEVKTIALQAGVTSVTYSNGNVSIPITATCGRESISGIPMSTTLVTGITGIPAQRSAAYFFANGGTFTGINKRISGTNGSVEWNNNDSDQNGVSYSVDATDAYNAGWNAAIDAATGEWVCTGGNSKQLYDDEYDTYVLAWVSYDREQLYRLPAKKT